MENIEEINNKVLKIISKSMNKESLMLEDEIELSSIETLKLLTKIERAFQVEVDDEYVFKGLFSSPQKVSNYVYEKLQE